MLSPNSGFALNIFFVSFKISVIFYHLDAIIQKNISKATKFFKKSLTLKLCLLKCVSWSEDKLIEGINKLDKDFRLKCLISFPTFLIFEEVFLMTRQKHLSPKAMIAFITFMNMYPPLSTDMYLPALPEMGKFFGAENFLARKIFW